MSYVHCPNCNQKALSVATRCPRCGVAFDTRFAGPPAPRPRRLGLGLVLAGAAAAVLLVVNLVEQKVGRGSRPAAPETTVTATRPPAPAPERPPTAKAPAQKDTLARSAPPAAPPAAPPPRPAAERPIRPATSGQSRYAKTWVNVRSGRSPRAPVIGTLRPGETVAVDLPEQGWYRVMNERQAPGYVDGRFLDTSPPRRMP